ncbi:hypothetical protein H0W91_03305 [Patescibacteria group bacterium]|nr:hypothetical protein [Patescibacteria group bacterium]
MDIKQKEQEFLSLLKASYEAQLTHVPEEKIGGVIRDSKNVIIKEATLKQYGFGERDFWDIICPSLKQQGYLESYDDSDQALNVNRSKYYETFPEYNKKLKLQELSESLPLQYTKESLYKYGKAHFQNNGLGLEKLKEMQVKVEKIKEDIKRFKYKADEDYEHIFVINEAKIAEKLTTNILKKYSDVQEPIKIKTLGIEIRGNYIFKGHKKSRINETDRCLIYFLYYKYLENKDECFEPSRLLAELKSEKVKKSEGYIKNRIVIINKTIKELIVRGKTNIRSFIKHEQGRGYHLNPKILI